MTGNRATGDTDWAAALAARSNRAPVQPRLTLWAGNVRIGSVAPTLFARLASEGLSAADLGCASPTPLGEPGCSLPADPTPALQRIGQALRSAGLVRHHPPERLAVTPANGAPHTTLGWVSRDIARLLGLTTHSVHLVGWTAGGHCWVQRRAWTKAEDPGLWDTLVGATVAHGESPEQALARELWEEAGLQPEQLIACQPCGDVRVSQPRGDDGLAHQVERIRCFAAWLPPGLLPVNRDGEVLGFECLSPAELNERLRADAFTVEAACAIWRAQQALGTTHTDPGL